VRVGILALQGDFAEHRSALADLGVDTRLVRRPEDLSDIDGLVLPGGESTTMSMLVDSSGLYGPLAKEISGGLPVFGTCAGMILLAKQVTDGRPDQRCFGAIDLVVRRNGYGRQLESFECDVDVGVLGPPGVHAVFIRAPVVEAVGQDVDVLATVTAPARRAPLGAQSQSCNGAPGPAVCRQGPVLVTAFHPELTADRRLHELFVSSVANGGAPPDRIDDHRIGDHGIDDHADR